MDGGKWYDIKLEGIKKVQRDQEKCSVPPITGWDNFPSVSLPKHFNQGHIHHHIVESVQFISQEKCDENCEMSDDDADIEDLHTNKPMKRGKDFVKSNFILEMKDCHRNGSYFLKATVWASYSSIDRKVMVEISQDSGFVKDASCTCEASGMGRCSHVAGLLFKLEDHIKENGTAPMTCTSKKSYWGQGKKRQKDPKNVAETEYQSTKKKKVDDIISYDPTPNYTQRTTDQALSEFLTMIESSDTQTTTMWDTLLYRQYEDYQLDDEQLSLLENKVEQLQQNLCVASDVPVELVPVQGTPDWYLHRRVRVTASTAKSVSAVSSSQAVSSILKNKLWVESKKTLGMLYGTENENKAFDDYSTSFQDRVVSKTGMWVHPDKPQIGASPDGLISDPAEQKGGLLEIKCPFVLQNKLVENFEKVQVGKDQEKAQSEKDSHSKNRGGKKPN